VGLALSRDTLHRRAGRERPNPRPNGLPRVASAPDRNPMPAACPPPSESGLEDFLFHRPGPAAPRSLSGQAPAAPPNAIWIGARIHLIVVDPGLLREASRGALQPPGSRRSRNPPSANAIGKDPADLDRQSPGLLAAGQLSGTIRHRRPPPSIPARIFAVRPAPRRRYPKIALADLKPERAAYGCPPSTPRPSWRTKASVLVALRDQRTQDARENLAARHRCRLHLRARCWARIRPASTPIRPPRPARHGPPA